MRSYSVNQADKQDNGSVLPDILFIVGLIALCVGAAMLFIK